MQLQQRHQRDATSAHRRIYSVAAGLAQWDHHRLLRHWHSLPCGLRHVHLDLARDIQRRIIPDVCVKQHVCCSARRARCRGRHATDARALADTNSLFRSAISLRVASLELVAAAPAPTHSSSIFSGITHESDTSIITISKSAGAAAGCQHRYRRCLSDISAPGCKGAFCRRHQRCAVPATVFSHPKIGFGCFKWHK